MMQLQPVVRILNDTTGETQIKKGEIILAAQGNWPTVRPAVMRFLGSLGELGIECCIDEKIKMGGAPGQTSGAYGVRIKLDEDQLLSPGQFEIDEFSLPKQILSAYDRWIRKDQKALGMPDEEVRKSRAVLCDAMARAVNRSVEKMFEDVTQQEVDADMHLTGPGLKVLDNPTMAAHETFEIISYKVHIPKPHPEITPSREEHLKAVQRENNRTLEWTFHNDTNSTDVRFSLSGVTGGGEAVIKKLEKLGLKIRSSRDPEIIKNEDGTVAPEGKEYRFRSGIYPPDALYTTITSKGQAQGFVNVLKQAKGADHYSPGVLEVIEDVYVDNKRLGCLAFAAMPVIGAVSLAKNLFKGRKGIEAEKPGVISHGY